MNPTIESFLDRPLSHRLGALGALTVIIIFVFWSYIYSPKAEELVTITEEVEKLEVEKTNELRISRNLRKFREEVKRLDIKLKYVLQELPDKREIPDLLTSISNLARDAGLEVSLFKPRAEIMRDFYAEVPVEVSVLGTFHQIETFFDEVGQLSRIVNITNIAITDPKVTDEKILVKTDCVATTFRYLDESERVQIENQNKAQNKRRR